MSVHILSLQQRVHRNARKRGVKIRTRRQWGTNFARGYALRLLTKRVTVKKADTLWQHITVTFDTGPLTGDFDKDMQTIERIGIERFGTGFSYNYAWDLKTGMIGVGQPLLARGAHTLNDKGIAGYSYNQNYVARAIAAMGMPGNKPTEEAIESLAQFIAAMIDEGALTEEPDYVPHSLVAAKECPTQLVRDVMPRIYRRAQAVKRSAQKQGRR